MATLDAITAFTLIDVTAPSGCPVAVTAGRCA